MRHTELQAIESVERLADGSTEQARPDTVSSSILKTQPMYR
jgi:hypothetical protein